MSYYYSNCYNKRDKDERQENIYNSEREFSKYQKEREVEKEHNCYNWYPTENCDYKKENEEKCRKEDINCFLVCCKEKQQDKCYKKGLGSRKEEYENKYEDEYEKDYVEDFEQKHQERCEDKWEENHKEHSKRRHRRGCFCNIFRLF